MKKENLINRDRKRTKSRDEEDLYIEANEGDFFQMSKFDGQITCLLAFDGTFTRVEQSKKNKILCVFYNC